MTKGVSASADVIIISHVLISNKLYKWNLTLYPLSLRLCGVITVDAITCPYSNLTLTMGSCNPSATPTTISHLINCLDVNNLPMYLPSCFQYTQWSSRSTLQRQGLFGLLHMLSVFGYIKCRMSANSFFYISDMINHNMQSFRGIVIIWASVLCVLPYSS